MRARADSCTTVSGARPRYTPQGDDREGGMTACLAVGKRRSKPSASVIRLRGTTALSVPESGVPDRSAGVALRPHRALYRHARREGDVDLAALERCADPVPQRSAFGAAQNVVEQAAALALDPVLLLGEGSLVHE